MTLTSRCRRYVRLGVLLLLVLAAVAPQVLAQAPEARRGDVVLLEVRGSINPAVADYLSHAIDAAAQEGAALVLVELDTPGGLLESTRTIVQTLLTAPLPVAVWVGPAGARAASAGMFVTLAANVAAMAPGTNIGAATPVSGQGKDVKEGGEDLARKVLEDTRAFARSIGEVRGRPVDWMERAVTEAASVTADEALAAGVIDLIARDRAELLAKIHGRQVTVAGQAVTVAVTGAVVRAVEMRPGQKILHLLAHPNIAYLLFLLGILGIYFEISQPGGFIPGTLGAIALLLAFVAMQVLPIQVGGLALILLSLALFVAEAFLPSLGILTLGGFVAFVLGSLLLFDTPELDLRLDPWLIAGATAAFGAAALTVGGLVLRSLRRPVRTGVEAMVGARAEALTPLAPTGKVFVAGEIWNARLAPEADHIAKGEWVRILRVDGMQLIVAPLGADEVVKE